LTQRDFIVYKIDYYKGFPYPMGREKTMLDLAKKAALIGTGMALAATDKIQGVVDNLAEKGKNAGQEARETVRSLVKNTQQTRDAVAGETEKVMTDVTAFWFYANWRDEMEDQVEKVVTLLLEKLHIPERRDLEDVRARIERLEKDLGQDS
jgi:polyhydroxyalkanoate synthesis regulator phasin